MNIHWNERALIDMRKQLAYCNSKFGKKVAESCRKNMIVRTNVLAIFPYAGVREPLLIFRKEGFRALVIHPNVKVIYYVEEETETVHILRLWDTRMNPIKLIRRFR